MGGSEVSEDLPEQTPEVPTGLPSRGLNRRARRALAKQQRRAFVPKPSRKAAFVSGICRNPNCRRASRRQQLFLPGRVCGQCLTIGRHLALLWPFYISEQDRLMANILAEFERQEAEDALEEAAEAYGPGSENELNPRGLVGGGFPVDGT